MKILILAAGMGKRMKSKMPKVMHSILEKPMLNWVIDTSKKLTSEIAVVLGHGIENVKTIVDEDIEIFEQKEMLGTGHAVMSAEDFLVGEELLVLYGDVPLISEGTLKELISKHRNNKNSATILTVDLDDPTGYGRIVRDSDGNFKKIVEHKDCSDEELNIKEINSGIAVYNIDELKKALKKINNNNVQKEYYLPDTFLHFKKVQTHKIKDITEVTGVNNRIQLSQLERKARENKLKELMLNGVTIIDPESTYISPDVQIGIDTIIYPQTYIYGATQIGEDCIIGPMTRIKNSKIGNNSNIIRSECEEAIVKDNVSVGPFARLRTGTILEDKVKIGNYVETKKANVHEGSKAQHLTYLGDAEIGEGVNIGAGTITCNYDGINKHKTKIENGTFIGSNSSLVAPVTIGENVTVAAGSVITKNIPKNSLAFGRAKQVIKEGKSKFKK
ncbi:bifunctional UDP-N-acetylglucosamine diphosphorylase/glucosamine-1-phosphate N-acetyltransferase GlmU [Geotoga petraea]|jgi:bifunctional UDP-N-acetylglucosamine pyrophosphorylase/glucosamine-1-phosphate N-acetyltransferase|uniref:Bifunctional protein GlmU n=1 Tax=Geotoga petraea TaxID=28234 RepID=A0A4Z0VXC9_9BACT|nr:bifunctional UDP-N-acetylglucosamine diphosphorylase/glucosamine-1-phosphate N-acetyltransferase GlmU [Geotoga petraea]MDK2946058.1 bifunctional UDP-N-acetylglucosamine pyrophosphorylase / glucosamine-phosphate N-acetyltransferase [Geotoga sp.]TGG88758.1 bifunctional UDP-N-acetylglucosamine diphosphorylase/glucosamine-1-phosphate N-acetyltransferase GlmU [Geotoga petraea]